MKKPQNENDESRFTNSIVYNPDDFKASQHQSNHPQISPFSIRPLPAVEEELSTSELSKSQSPKRGLYINEPVTQEYSNPYLDLSKSNINNNPSNNNDNRNNIDTSNFDQKPLNNQNNSKLDPNKAHKSYNNVKGTSVDKDGKVRDHSNLIKSMNNYESYKTPFKYGIKNLLFNL